MNNKIFSLLFRRKATGKNFHQLGFSLVEVMVSAFILSIVIAGLAYFLLAGRKQAVHSRARIQALQLSKLFLAPLQMDVRQDTWSSSSNMLYAGIRYCDSDAGHTQMPTPPCLSEADRTIDGIIYSATYTITHDNPIADVNKVKLNITWTEPSP